MKEKNNKINKLKNDKLEYEFKEITRVSIAEAKSNFSEYVSRAAFSNEKIIITKRGKPITALVSIHDIKELDNKKEIEGLKKAIGKWENFDEIEPEIKKIYKSRSEEKSRDVSF